MKKLLQRYFTALTVLVIVFGLYALIAVPQLEPRLELHAGEATTHESGDTAARLKQHRDHVGHLFPKGSWQLGEPKVLETEYGTLLFKDYKPVDNGRVELKPLAIILYSGKPTRGVRAADARPIILDAPDGAILQFDSQTDPGRADFGRLLGGLLVGQITISSPPTSSQADDALLLTTRNVQLDERRIWTPHEVDFRYGSSYGSGRDLVITLLPSASGGKGKGPSIEGLKTLELVHLDKLHIEAAGDAFLPSSKKPPKNAAATNAPKPPAAPIELTCQGPFLFDFVDRVASFEDQVDIIRLNPDGPSDQLNNCQLFSIYMKPPAKDATAKSAPKDKAKPQFATQVERVVAVGHPVVLRAPSMGATARGEKFEYQVATRRIVLEDHDRVTLVDQRFDIEARQLEYELAENGGLGRLWAAGPGKLRARRPTTASTKPNSTARRLPIMPIASASPSGVTTMEATWGKELRLRQHEGQHVVSLIEKASVGVVDMGGFNADEIHLWLIEEPPAPNKPKPAPGALSQEALGVKPDRMLATGHVHLHAAQFEGDAQRLELWFRDEVVPAPAPTNPASVTNPGNNVVTSPPPTNPIAPGVPPPAATDKQAEKPKPPAQKIHMLGDVVRAQLLRRGEAATLEHISVDGHVKLWDEPLPGAINAGGPPQLLITGDALQLQGGMEANAVVSVLGKPASITAQGMTLRGENVNLQRAQNRMWIEGAGDMLLPLTSDLSGQKLAKVMNAQVTWQDGLELDGETARFGGNVEVQTENKQQWARADLLDVALSRRIDFANPQSGKPEVTRITFSQNFALENHSADERGKPVSLDKMHAQIVRIEQQSGRMEAEGPGWVSTVRVGTGTNPLAATGPMTRPVSTGAARKDDTQLTYLFVEFQKQIVGNFFHRQVEFQRNVRAIYGPVASWNDTISADLEPEQMPEQTVVMECQRLELRQMPGSFPDTTTVEMEATGDTVVEGRGFTARASRISYQHEKQLLVLDGEGRQEAELTRQTRIGAPQSHLQARKIRYWRIDNRVEFDDWKMLDLQQLNEIRPAKK